MGAESVSGGHENESAGTAFRILEAFNRVIDCVFVVVIGVIVIDVIVIAV